jgi:hypothetical protein
VKKKIGRADIGKVEEKLSNILPDDFVFIIYNLMVVFQIKIGGIVMITLSR